MYFGAATTGRLPALHQTDPCGNNLEYYNLDMIIAVGYRVNSKRATEFRQWSTAMMMTASAATPTTERRVVNTICLRNFIPILWTVFSFFPLLLPAQVIIHEIHHFQRHFFCDCPAVFLK